MQIALKDFTGQVLRQTEFPIQLNGRKSSMINVGSMTQWRTRPMDTYLSWHWKDVSGETLARSSALWCAPVEANLPPSGVQCVKTDEGFEVSADSYVPLVQLSASVPGKWSDNGMSLEPGQPVVVNFCSESEAKLEFDVEVRSLGSPTQ